MVLPARYDLEDVLEELTKSTTAVLGLRGSGVTMAEKGRLHYVTAVNHSSGELERIQEEMQAGPCRDAYDTGEVVRVTDVRQESARWPDFSDTAIRVGVAGVAGIPMRLAGETIGALNMKCVSSVGCRGVLSTVLPTRAPPNPQTGRYG